MYRNKVTERGRATRRSPLQTQSSHGVVPASAVLRRSPTPNWQLPSNASIRGPLQAARKDTQAKTPIRRQNFGHRHEDSATLFELTTCTSSLAAPYAEATHDHGDTSNAAS